MNQLTKTSLYPKNVFEISWSEINFEVSSLSIMYSKTNKYIE